MRSVWRRVVVTYASPGPGPSVQKTILTDRLTSVLGPALPSGWAVSRSHSRSTSAMVGGRVSVPSTSIWPTSQKNLMYAAFLKRTVPAGHLNRSEAKNCPLLPPCVHATACPDPTKSMLIRSVQQEVSGNLFFYSQK